MPDVAATPDDSYPESWGYQRHNSRDDEPATPDPATLKSGLSNYGSDWDTGDDYPTEWRRT